MQTLSWRLVDDRYLDNHLRLAAITNAIFRDADGHIIQMKLDRNRFSYFTPSIFFYKMNPSPIIMDYASI